MNKLVSFLIASLLAAPAFAAPMESFDTFHIKAGKAGMRADKYEFRSSGGTGIHTLKSTNSSNTNRTLTLPDATDTLVGKATTDTLTNKTLTAPTATSPVISGTVTGSASYTTPTLTSPTISGTLTGAPTMATPWTAANVNQSVKRESLPLNFKGGDVLTDGVTYVVSIPMVRAGTIKAISVCAHTRMAGGTDTLALAKKQGGTTVTLLSTATVDPTAVPSAADTAQALTLTATGADLIFASGDCLKATLVCGTMSTDGQGYAINIDVEYTDI